LGKYEQALSDFTKVIELDPDDPEAYYERGFTYLRLNNWEEAIADYDRSIALDHGDAATFYNRACAHAQLRHYDQAEADLEKALPLTFEPPYLEPELRKHIREALDSLPRLRKNRQQDSFA
jgi:tetratricopeptide (TPR) repeat protein